MRYITPFPLSDMSTIWADTFYPRHLRPLTDAMKTKCEEGTLCAHDIRTYLFNAGKITADESLRGEQNYARLSVTYDMNTVMPRTYRITKTAGA
jgi:hypothetical protein